MQIKPDEITSILKSRIEGLDEGQADLTEVGTVLSVADGIARIHGLENCQAFEMLELPHDVTGLALNVESTTSAPCSWPWDQVVEGDTVKRSGACWRFRSARSSGAHRLAARATARRQAKVNTYETRPAQFKAPGVVQRQPVEEPMQTG